VKLFSRFGLFLLLGVSSWILFLAYRYLSVITGLHISGYQYSVLVASVIGFNLLFVAEVVHRVEKWKVSGFLWYLVSTGGIGLAIAGALKGIAVLFADQKIGELIVPIAESVMFYAFLIFCGTGIAFVRKLIFYQKKRRKVWFWWIFLGIMAGGIVLLFDPAVIEMQENSVFSEPGTETQKTIFSILRYVLIVAFVAMTILLALQAHWSAYLTFKQKLLCIFLVFLVVLLFGAYLYSFPTGIFATRSLMLFVDLAMTKYTIISFIFYFPLTYFVVSGLVLIFNLPTSSEFERRSSEITSFQQISQFLQTDFDREKILRNLLDAGVLISNSTCGWFEYAVGETNGSETQFEIGQMKEITPKEIQKLTEASKMSAKIAEKGTFEHIRNIRKVRELKPAKSNLKSLVALPVSTRKSTIGILYVGHSLSNAYEDELIQSLVALADQAAISIENASLIHESIATERYQRELKIAREVQQQILPKSLPENNRIGIHAVSQDAEEIGGDFYDIFTPDPDHFEIALGDVSGKGTEAAFYMAETKGIFQALSQLNLSVRDFMIMANSALSRCFKKGAFMSMTYLRIDLEQKQFEILRAGHVPTLHYRIAADKLEFLEGLEKITPSPALAIRRDGSFANALPRSETRKFEPGDFLVLYTDGIVEARNSEGIDFGFQGMKDSVTTNRHMKGKLLPERILQSVKEFAGEKIQDDYTILVIRFL